MKYIYGPVPSRRMGLSLGISPIPKKTCNYSCIYCQLGRTDHMTGKRAMFYPVSDIISELEALKKEKFRFDVVTIVGEGEPLLYLGLGELLEHIRKWTDKPLAVITNGSMLGDRSIQQELAAADIVLPSLDAVDNRGFREVNRPHKSVTFEKMLDGLIDFSHNFHGQLWLEIMLLKGINDDPKTLGSFSAILKKIKYDRLYINTPVRPPAEEHVEKPENSTIDHAIELLGGISLDHLISEGFQSDIEDHQEAVMSIIKRHPMNRFEIEGFLKSRECNDTDKVLEQLRSNVVLRSTFYKGYETFRFK
jgi:wyosine [tRNA(Phe)-imidazoG37] synthetase (radical SAM superfamily)